MTDVVLFHHVQGLTDGVRAFADQLAEGGRTVHTPDLFDGETPASLEEGMAFAQSIDDDVVRERVDAALSGLPPELVFAGISFGIMEAQRLAQTRPGARGALLYEGCLPITGEWAFGPWPDGVPVQIHGKDDDAIFAHEGDVEAARGIVDTVGPDLAELFLYPGNTHLFLDSTLPTYDAEATALAVRRSRALLDRVG
ncbi:dienelactone hydrolase family protein [Mumia sp. zg.B53]|uniref:dienelactone hydrolase family protein n=1 Tax=Mumia sp. zg.B53 TaxID=2855449 RepID=UPI001C6EADAF|nr:dienelactone hydrolase family protein [Mumia sp. zg.B53]MBW9216087.1 dienelactone hydrolase family protein [Mumia sp. zg.B53]